MVATRNSTSPSKTQSPTTPSTPTTQGGGGRAADLKKDVRGMSFTDGEKRLAPPVNGVPSASLTKVSDDLGQVADMRGFSATLGQFLEKLVPGEGQGVEAELKVGVKSAAFYGKFNVKTGVKHTAAGYELSGGIGLEVGARVQDPYFGAYIEGYAKGSLGVTAKGDSGEECFRLVGLGMHEYLANEAEVACDVKDPKNADEERLRQVVKQMSLTGMAGRRVAAALFGEGYSKTVLAEMDGLEQGDEADVLEVEGELGAGIGLGVDGGEGGDKIGARGGIGYRSKDTLGKKDGKLTKESEAGWVFSASAEATLEGKTVKGEINFFKKHDKPAEIELKVELPVTASSVAAGAGAIWDTWSGVVRTCIAHGQGKLAGAELKRIEDALVQVPRGAALAQLAKSGFFHPALEFKGKFADDKVTLGVDLLQSKSFERNALGAKVEGEIKTTSNIFEGSFPVPLNATFDAAKKISEGK